MHARSHDERQALAEGAAGVEVGRQRDDGALVHQRPPRRHRAVEEERGDREQNGRDVALGQGSYSVRACRLEVVDAHRAQLYGEGNAAGLGELVRVQAEPEAGLSACLEVAPGLSGVERTPLQEDVGGLGDLRRLREHLGEREVEVGVGIRELGRDRVRAEPGRRAARLADDPQHRELRVAVEAVAGLRLEGRRPRGEHPRAVQRERVCEALLTRRTRRPDRGQDPASGRMQLLVGGAARTKLELLGPGAREDRVRVAVDEPGDGSAAAPVQLLDVAVERIEVAHAADSGDPPVLAEDERVLDDVDGPHCLPPADRRLRPCRGDGLREVADRAASPRDG